MTLTISAGEVEAIVRDMKLPAITIYPGDWMRDNVAGCTPDAQALWLRMMFVMHDARPYGHLAEASAPMRPEAVARRCGFVPREYKAALERLEAAAVPRLTGSDEYRSLLTTTLNTAAGEVHVDLSPLGVPIPGVVYSLRMVRDHRLRVIRKLVGKLGGNPNLVTGSENLVNHPPNQVSDYAGARVGARAENENEKTLNQPKEKKNPEGVQGEPLALFSEAWDPYPRKRGRHEAERHYRAQVRSIADHTALLSAISNYRRELEILGTDDVHTLHGSTFFNNRWREYVDGEWQPPKPPKAAGATPIRTPHSVPTQVKPEIQAVMDGLKKGAAR